MEIQLGHKVDVQTFKPESKTLTDITLHVNLKQDTKKVVCEHEDDLNDLFIKLFNSRYIALTNYFVLRYKDYTLYITAVVGVGYVDKNTKIEWVSQDPNLIIMSRKTLKRELFKENYDFTTLGIGGLNKQLVMTFRRALSTRAYNTALVHKLNIKHVKGILLYGPAGVGKTLIARKIGALISPIEPKIVNGPEIMNKYVGESEKNIRELFKDAINDNDPSNLHVIIFDEIDAICRKRGQDQKYDNMVNQLLTMIDGVKALNNICIIGMTNRKDLLDEALLRAGRIEIHIPIGLPDEQGRIDIFKIHTKNLSDHGCLEAIDYIKLAQLTNNYSGAEIEAIVNNAISRSMYEKLQQEHDESIRVTMKHFIDACHEVKSQFIHHQDLSELLPSTMDDRFDHSYSIIVEFIKTPHRIESAIVRGKMKCGKTTFMTQLLLKTQITYKHLIQSKDVVHLDDYHRCQFLIDLFERAYVMDQSIIVIDDVEILLNYTTFGQQIMFSNKVYQTLLSLLKTLPPANHQLTVVLICQDTYLINQLSSCVDKIVELTKND